MRAVCAKVWDPDREPEPEGLFNRRTCPDAPPRWFEEDPEYAAELFALETKNDGVLNVLDTRGELHRFSVEVRRTTEVKTTRVRQDGES